MGRFTVVLACLLGGWAVPVFGQSNTPTSPALAALATGDCRRIGEAVNAGIDAKTPSAFYVAALLHEEGLCVEKSARQAATFYEATRGTGDQRAAVEIGLRYALGDVLPQSYTRASIWLWHAEGLARKLDPPRELKLPPATVDSRTEWLGYLAALHLYATRIVEFPLSARLDGAEADLQARVCPAADSVQVTVLSQSKAPVTAGVARTSGRRELSLAMQDAYDKAMKTLPKATRPESENRECSNRTISFRLR